MAERWLVTGASGQLGGHVVAQLMLESPTPALTAWAGTQDVGFGAVTVERIDLADVEAVRAAVLRLQPTHVIHLGAVTAVGAAYADPDRAKRVNIDGTRMLGEAVAQVGARLIYGSTDMVFDGEAAPYDEDAAPRPLSVYGQTKLLGEESLGGWPDVLIVRLPLMYGFAVGPRETTFGKQIEAVRAGAPLKLFTDEYRTPIWLADAARALIGLARSTRTGLIHVAGPERLSRYELVERCAGWLPDVQPNFIAISRTAIDAPEPRPADLSLDGRRFAGEFPELAAGPLRPEVVRQHG